jgi:predicted metal-binding protein
MPNQTWSCWHFIRRKSSMFRSLWEIICLVSILGTGNRKLSSKLTNLAMAKSNSKNCGNCQKKLKRAVKIQKHYHGIKVHQISHIRQCTYKMPKWQQQIFAQITIQLTIRMTTQMTTQQLTSSVDNPNENSDDNARWQGQMTTLYKNPEENFRWQPILQSR